MRKREEGEEKETSEAAKRIRRGGEGKEGGKEEGGGWGGIYRMCHNNQFDIDNTFFFNLDL